MAATFLFSCLSFLLFSTCVSLKSSSVKPINGGFAISLIHRDSPQSPLFNQSMTPYEIHVAAAHRSVSRTKHLHLQATSQSGKPPEISTKLVPDNIEYIVSYYIGTPPTQVYAFADTGSAFIWTKGAPYFDPTRSSSYTSLSCNSSNCTMLDPARRTCTNGSQPCTYQFWYADGATTSGVLSYDKFAFDAPKGTSLVDVGYLQFGCSNEYSSRFTGKQNGCLGLNRGLTSLISQLGIKRFSHCMVIPDDRGSGSRMYFGSMAVISGDKTPLVGNKRNYHVNLDGISIGDTMVAMPPGIFNVTRYGTGGVIVDSGTTYTLIISEGYYPILEMMRQFIHRPLTKGPQPFDLCFEGTYDDLSSIPNLTFHFPGVNVTLMKVTTFVEAERGVWCLAILRCDDRMSVIGSFQMRNYWVGYDLESEGISFEHADCATF